VREGSGETVRLRGSIRQGAANLHDPNRLGVGGAIGSMSGGLSPVQAAAMQTQAGNGSGNGSGGQGSGGYAESAMAPISAAQLAAIMPAPEPTSRSITTPVIWVAIGTAATCCSSASASGSRVREIRAGLGRRKSVAIVVSDARGGCTGSSGCAGGG